MFKLVATTVLLFTMASASIAGSPQLASKRVVPDEGVPGRVGVWQGGPNTLPYGIGDALGVITHARAMLLVQHAMADMIQRGYMRREDLDCAFTKLGYSCAIVGYQKPGHDPLTPGEVQPVLMVITKAFDVPGEGSVPATQVFCGLVRDSSGTVVPASTESDSAIFILGTPRVPDTGRSGGPGLNIVSPEGVPYIYAAYDSEIARSLGMQSVWMWYSEQSPGTQEMWQQWAARTAAGAFSGAVGGYVQTIRTPGGTTWWGLASGISAGVIVGVIGAQFNWWATPPDTSRIRH